MAKIVIYHCTARTGGATGALDAIDGNELEDGYRAIVMIPGGAPPWTSALYFYYLDTDSGATESDPSVIRPDTNYGTKRWIRVT